MPDASISHAVLESIDKRGRDAITLKITPKNVCIDNDFEVTIRELIAHLYVE